MDPIALLQDRLEQTATFGARVLESPTPLDVETLQQKVKTLDSLVRETFQEALRDTYQAIADKLDKGRALEPAEREALELLFVGEAKYYLKTENNYQDWIEELQRLIGEMRSTREAGLERIDDLMHVQALCRDASHVLPEVIYYLQESERVQRFRTSVRDQITPEDGRMLARMIRDLMASPYR